jgi:hypothetical protein
VWAGSQMGARRNMWVSHTARSCCLQSGSGKSARRQTRARSSRPTSPSSQRSAAAAFCAPGLTHPCSSSATAALRTRTRRRLAREASTRESARLPACVRLVIAGTGGKARRRTTSPSGTVRSNPTRARATWWVPCCTAASSTAFALNLHCRLTFRWTFFAPRTFYRS